MVKMGEVLCKPLIISFKRFDECTELTVYWDERVSEIVRNTHRRCTV